MVESSASDAGAADSPSQFSILAAEPGFIDDGNLEEGETLLHALKAFEASPMQNGYPSKLLVAGALVEDKLGGVTIWLGDSIERGVGPNMQVAAALNLVDSLVLFYLRACTAQPLRRGLPLMAYAPRDTASRLALRQRGFVDEKLSDTVTDDLMLRMCPTAAAAEYARSSAACDGNILADEISRLLSFRASARMP
jgi:hypothetical protein